ncbi:B3 domain-containing protein Os01g0234100-like [Apium graveolens]|uniref:B3 domain-containing protein Os01g0234100-like n=1 Tax=Apium graveolens TaxID=4045 RepID=UPI003D7AD902
MPRGHLLGLPRSFCESHLPECDDKVVLVCEDNSEYITEFSASKCTLGGHGWKQLAGAKNLVHGDANNTRIVCPTNSGTNFFAFSNFKRDLCASDIFMKLEEETVIKYFELCCSQKIYLHSNLVGDWNPAFIAATISELVDVSKAIRCSHLNTPCDMYQKREVKLGHIEDLGMEVGFLHRRLQRLLALACNPNTEAKRKRMQEARALKENTEARVKQMQETLKSLNQEIAVYGQKRIGKYATNI